MPTSKLIDFMTRLLETQGLTGVIVILLGGTLWILWKVIKQHDDERREISACFGKMHAQSLETIEKNTEALSKLSTIVQLTCSRRSNDV